MADFPVTMVNTAWPKKRWRIPVTLYLTKSEITVGSFFSKKTVTMGIKLVCLKRLLYEKKKKKTQNLISLFVLFVSLYLKPRYTGSEATSDRQNPFKNRFGFCIRSIYLRRTPRLHGERGNERPTNPFKSPISPFKDGFYYLPVKWELKEMVFTLVTLLPFHPL